MDDRGDWNRTRFKTKLEFYWLSEEGNEYHVPDTQLILYPKYPEVRFSGFLKGCKNAPSDFITRTIDIYRKINASLNRIPMILQMEVYILDNEQPTGCPKCGTRTEFTETIINEMLVQHHHCPQPLCIYKFIGEFDKGKGFAQITTA